MVFPPSPRHHECRHTRSRTPDTQQLRAASISIPLPRQSKAERVQSAGRSWAGKKRRWESNRGSKSSKPPLPPATENRTGRPGARTSSSDKKPGAAPIAPTTPFRLPWTVQSVFPMATGSAPLPRYRWATRPLRLLVITVV
ncbi:hypothetical protein PSPO01_00130 [Paraphaeosphaeria sporulosa]